MLGSQKTDHDMQMKGLLWTSVDCKTLKRGQIRKNSLSSLRSVGHCSACDKNILSIFKRVREELFIFILIFYPLSAFRWWRRSIFLAKALVQLDKCLVRQSEFSCWEHSQSENMYFDEKVLLTISNVDCHFFQWPSPSSYRMTSFVDKNLDKPQAPSFSIGKKFPFSIVRKCKWAQLYWKAV